MSSIIGRMFVVTTFGESHSPAVGAVIDGCPSCLKVSESDIQKQLDRRKPGQSCLTTQRVESDRALILSGIENGVTLGSPIAIMISNNNVKPGDYKQFRDIPRPSHADFTYKMKYGIIASSGGGRASARETASRVAAGAVAEKLLQKICKAEIIAWVSSVGTIDAPDLTETKIAREDVDTNPVRCPDIKVAKKMGKLISDVQDRGDSVGGIITCVCRNIPAGWGEPVFDKINAVLAQAMLSIPAVRGFEIGSGFGSARMLGSNHNDLFVAKKGRLGTKTNRSGGIQGGITNGEPLIFRVAFKPTATIKTSQRTVTYSGRSVILAAKEGRHDPCVLPRAVPVVESMAAIVLADMALRAGVRL